VTLFEDLLPALSAASTLNVFCPTLEVSTASPSAAVPVQLARP